MGEYFLVEYGQVYELCNRDGFVYATITKHLWSQPVYDCICERFNPQMVTLTEWQKIREGE